MELKKNRGGAHLITLIVHKPILTPSPSANSTPYHRSRPKSFFFRENVSAACSEPSSPKVNCAGRVKERGVVKAAAECKGEKKRKLVRSLTSSLRGSRLVGGGIWCWQSPQKLVIGEEEEEQEEGGGGEAGDCDLARWFMMAELAGKGGVEGEMSKGSVLVPLNALQLMKQRSAPARVGEVVGDRKRNSF